MKQCILSAVIAICYLCMSVVASLLAIVWWTRVRTSTLGWFLVGVWIDRHPAHLAVCILNLHLDRARIRLTHLFLALFRRRLFVVEFHHLYEPPCALIPPGHLRLPEWRPPRAILDINQIRPRAGGKPDERLCGCEMAVHGGPMEGRRPGGVLMQQQGGGEQRKEVREEI